uniref:Acetyl-coenzyme A carboxylase carboxyl transferase subunit beta n=1 Tax=Monotropa hypopitys var. americana TaxID=1862694 RepID=A0A221SQX7_9ERIC|nr:acetyl-CoA carboxylase carboxyltransferase beta subunit [Monotropa hypopitys var. americana]
MQIKNLIDSIGVVPFSIFSIWSYKLSKLKQTQISSNFKILGNAKRRDESGSYNHRRELKKFDKNFDFDIVDLENKTRGLASKHLSVVINYFRDTDQFREDLEQRILDLESTRNQLKERKQQRALDRRRTREILMGDFDQYTLDIERLRNKMKLSERQYELDQSKDEEIDKKLNEIEDGLQYYKREIMYPDNGPDNGTDNGPDNGPFQQKKIAQENEIYPDKKSNEEGSDNKSHPDYSHLWVQCKSCYGINYKSLFNSKLYICEWCQSHVQMNSSDRIGFLVDSDTWSPMDEDMFSLDPIEFDYEKEVKPFDFVKWESGVDGIIEEIHENLKELIKEREKADKDHFDAEEGKTEQEHLDGEEGKTEQEHFDAEEGKTEQEHLDGEEGKTEQEHFDAEEEEENEKTYEERLNYYQSETGLNDAIQTGIAEIKGIPVALGVMDFKFIAGTMGSVVGEKITRLIEYAIKEFLPLVIICASGGARMQEGSLSLMQMSKIACALYTYKLDKKLFYVSILTSPTTGGVTASFGMLGNVIISEPGAVIAFAGRRVIEETLHIEVPEGAQETEYLFQKGAFDLILSRKYFKRILSLLYLFHNYRLAFA